jgi:hypothetical protein
MAGIFRLTEPADSLEHFDIICDGEKLGHSGEHIELPVCVESAGGYIDTRIEKFINVFFVREELYFVDKDSVKVVLNKWLNMFESGEVDSGHLLSVTESVSMRDYVVSGVSVVISKFDKKAWDTGMGFAFEQPE